MLRLHLEVGFIGWEFHNRIRGKNGRFGLGDNTEQLHVRCTPHTLAAIRGRANARHMTMSEYIKDLVRRDLSRVEYPHPQDADRFDEQ